MKNNSRLAAFLFGAAFMLTGCDTMGPNAQNGAVAGGVLGAATGGIVGYQTHNPLAGAAIGAGLGALAGGALGNSADQRERQAMAMNAAYIPLTTIASMASQGTPDSVIINEIQRTRSVYHLDSEIITYLKQNHVSDRVIDYMMATGR